MILTQTQNTFAQNAKALMLGWVGTRKQVSFLLNLEKGRDCEAFEIIMAMKSKRVFLPSVIKGLKIVYELGQGRVDTLVKEFPEVRKWLGVSDTAALEKKIDELTRLLATASQPHEIGQQPLAAPKPLAMPVFDDDETIEFTASAQADCGANLLKGLMNTQIH